MNKSNEEIAREILNRWQRSPQIIQSTFLIKEISEALDAKDAEWRELKTQVFDLQQAALRSQTAPLSKEDEAILKYIEKEVSGARLHGHISISFVDIERLVSLARRGSSPQAVVTDEKLHELSCKACDVHFRAATYNSYAAEKYRIGFRDGFRSRENFIELGGSL